MKRFFASFRGLQWKLTLSYGLTSALALLFLEIVVIVTIFVVINLNLPWVLKLSLQQQSTQAQPYFVHDGMPDQQALHYWINRVAVDPMYPENTLAITDRRGQIIASNDEHLLPPNTTLSSHIGTQVQANLRQVLNGKASDGLTHVDSAGVVTVVLPVFQVNSHRVMGALFLLARSDVMAKGNLYWLQFYALAVILPSFFVIFFISVLAGTIASFFTTRNFTRRLRGLSYAVNNWSQGNFSEFIKDHTRDEFGQLARQLDHMAEQLQNLLQTRQKLAVLRERNRLARDLHDSVKQQVFAITMRMGSALLLLDSDNNAVREHLIEADTLVHRAQEELTSLIHALRPAILVEKGLAAAIQEYVEEWKKQYQISIEAHLALTTTLPQDVEEALLRITQEGLTNVARHSQATIVQLHLYSESTQVVLQIKDNGRSFDPATVRKEGIGLHSMQERITSLGGTFHLAIAPGKGTTITVYYPAKEETS